MVQNKRQSPSFSCSLFIQKSILKIFKKTYRVYRIDFNRTWNKSKSKSTSTHKVKTMDELTQQKHADPTPSSFPHFSQFKANVGCYIIRGVWVTKKVLTRCFFLHLFFHPVNFSILLLPCPAFNRDHVLFT